MQLHVFVVHQNVVNDINPLAVRAVSAALPCTPRLSRAGPFTVHDCFSLYWKKKTKDFEAINLVKAISSTYRTALKSHVTVMVSALF